MRLKVETSVGDAKLFNLFFFLIYGTQNGSALHPCVSRARFRVLPKCRKNFLETRSILEDNHIMAPERSTSEPQRKRRRRKVARTEGMYLYCFSTIFF